VQSLLPNPFLFTYSNMLNHTLSLKNSRTSIVVIIHFQYSIKVNHLYCYLLDIFKPQCHEAKPARISYHNMLQIEQCPSFPSLFGCNHGFLPHIVFLYIPLYGEKCKDILKVFTFCMVTI
jgi:hypothetical protein